MVLIATPAYLAYKQSKDFHLLEKNRKAANSTKKTNEEILKELFEDEHYARCLRVYTMTAGGKEKEILKELKKRNFDFSRSNVDIIIENRKWTYYLIKNYKE